MKIVRVIFFAVLLLAMAIFSVIGLVAIPIIGLYAGSWLYVGAMKEMWKKAVAAFNENE